MKSYSLETLEYGEVLEIIKRYAQTSLGRKRIAKLQPIEEEKELEEHLRSLEEAIKLIEENQVSWQFSEIFDPSECLATLRIKNSLLKPQDLVSLASLCEQAFSVKQELKSFQNQAPTLWEKLRKLPETILKPAEQVRKKISSNGEMNDDASPELSKIRQEIHLLRSQLTKLLNRIIHQAGEAIQDEIVTQRNERFVIPVKADFRGKVNGVAHGFSSSGATIFIEPIESVQMNNELQILREKEEEEIRKILFEITELFREHFFWVEEAARIIAEFDFLKAKAKFASDFRAIVPKINHKETFILKNARHPLLEDSLRKVNKAIVPVSFELNKEKPVMIVSGANAGGKTVVLKTAGLLSLMALSALPVTASDAEIPIYNSILADIGDRQSLSANLSTFTSHISNIVKMIAECKAPALILLDEVGTGTDPEEGAALGVAIVDYFYRKCNAQVITSTHFRSLKIYAAMNDHVINACVEFNEKTLEPTYRLLTGTSGASSGLEIAKRFGLPEEIINKAKQNLETATQQVNEYLTKLKTEIKIVEDLRAALEKEREATAEKYEMLQKQAERQEKQRQEEFAKKLKESLDNFDRQTRSFLELLEDKALRAKLEKEVAKQKSAMKRQAISTLEEMNVNKSDETFFSEKPIQEGMKVLVKSLKTVGKVEKIQGQIASVLIGSMRINEKLENLQAVIEDSEEKRKEKQKEAPLRFDLDDRSAELNLIGKTTFEIEDEIDRFLDKSYMRGLRRVRIIHGIGTGALRQAVHRFLKSHPHVERFTLAAYDQGGSGATIVELKL
ncbi:MAG: endonuclease MutS2 [Pyrinomonadaceae bacterium]|nr:endonuclease MutS2 [Pyrinomonadaceae bacterium]